MSAGSARRGVVTGGTWCADHTKLVEFWPQEDAAVEILAEERHGGGSACNLACDLKRLDPAFPVETIGLVGEDEDGRMLLAEADAHGVDRRQLVVSREARTNYTDAFTSRRSGRRTHIYHQGTSALLTPDHFDFGKTQGRIFHLGLPGIHRIMDARWKEDTNGWVTVLRKAREAGLETNLELASIPPARLSELVRPCLAQLDLLIVNDVEIGAITGKVTSRDGEADLQACVAAARTALGGGRMRLVTVHFPMGAIAALRSGDVIVKPSVCVPPKEIAGANGAGDAFAAGMIFGLHEGWSVEDSMTLGHAAAAASLRKVGTTAGVETWKKCLELASLWGWRN